MEWTDESGRTFRVMKPGKFWAGGSRWVTPRRTTAGRTCEAIEILDRNGRATFFCWRFR
jgi:hypothetical protein